MNDRPAPASAGGYALCRIPVSAEKRNEDVPAEEGIDKIKIIELSCAADKWENELLFGDSGFFSLKFKEPSEKIKEFTDELKNYIENEIDKMKFSSAASKETAHKIKLAKIDSVKLQMELYSNSELSEWETETCDNALKTGIEKAVLYKNTPSVIENVFKNGINALKILSEKENWSKKLYSYKLKQYKSDFYTALIKAYLKENDINAYMLFNKYKDFIQSEGKDRLETAVNDMRINIIAYNWALEILSYKYSNSEFEAELDKIHEDNIRKTAEKYYRFLKKEEERLKILEEKEKNSENWKEVIKAAEENAEKAFLAADYLLNPESTKQKKAYIKQIGEYGAVKTDIKEFLNILENALTDFQSFKDKDISDFQGCLSKEDFEIIEKLHSLNADELKKISFDFKYALNRLKADDSENIEKKYEAASMYFILTSEYKTINKKEADYQERKKIIDLILQEIYFCGKKGEKQQ